MRKKFLFITVLVVLTLSATSADSRDRFLGTWTLKDSTHSIQIIKEEEKYYVIEFVHLKHELFFSGDGTRALFIEYGKGEGWDTTMLKLDGNSITDMTFSEGFTWKPTEYVYYKRN